MSELGDLRALLSELHAAGGCAHPVRLAGHSLDTATGEWFEGTVGVACKDRRAVVCPACAQRYRSDAWHLVAAGLRGGKGIPATVAGHPAVFATLTAPSFGPVHARRSSGPCRPRRGGPRCPHGTALGCTVHHGADDPVLGEPVCPECFDYEGAVLWNAQLRPLWSQTKRLVSRRLAATGALTVRDGAAALRLAYVKVAEFQRRGLVHLHAVVRADGATGPDTPPPEWLDAAVLASALDDAVRSATAASLGGGALSWGSELDVVPVAPGGAGDVSTVARYLAKYAVKSSEESGVLARPVTSLRRLHALGLRPHAERLVETAWHLGGRSELAELRLRAHAHTFGYRGHFATKSRRYSTTFGALRQARAAYHGAGEEREGQWAYAGRGYRTPSAARLAEVIASLRRDLPRRPPGVPHRLPADYPVARELGDRP